MNDEMIEQVLRNQVGILTALRSLLYQRGSFEDPDFWIMQTRDLLTRRHAERMERELNARLEALAREDT